MAPSINLVIFSLFAVAINGSSGSPIDTEILMARLDSLQTKFDQLEARNVELETRFNELSDENRKQEANIAFLTTQNAHQEEEIRLLKSRNSAESKIINRASSENVIDGKDSQIVDSSQKMPPSSCRQLSTIGHSLDGIYLVSNPDTNKIETVYCVFGQTLSETFYGSVDVKTKSVHFFVQRTGDFNLVNAVIPFNIEHLNEGGAMDLAAGVFTVPVDGIYHFEFSGLKDLDAADIFIFLQVNGVSFGTAYGANIPNYLALSTISTSLRLKVGDQVRLFKTTGTLNDGPYSHFTGWLVEEDF